MKRVLSGNIFDIGSVSPGNTEIFETLASGDVLVERIISNGQTTPDGEYYDQEKDEWVMLLSGEARLFFEDKGETALKAGDFLLIPAHVKHRVAYTSQSPPCVWLAIHGHLSGAE